MVRPFDVVTRVDQQWPANAILIKITQMDMVPVGAVVGIGGEAICEVATRRDSVL